MPEYVRIRIEELAALRERLSIADEAIRGYAVEMEALYADLEKMRARAEAAEESLRLAADEGMPPW